MSSAYGKIDRPKENNSAKLESLLPIESRTKYDKLVSVHSLTIVLQQNENESKLISYLQDLLNKEIEAGNTYPQNKALNASEFKNYFLSGDAFIVVNGGKIFSTDFYDNLEENILGTFYIKPNFPGRCSHVRINMFIFRYFISYNSDL
jgi:antitoxin component YwqK of YwqJK toxin-antitoxin module